MKPFAAFAASLLFLLCEASVARGASCGVGSPAAAAQNAVSLDTIPWAPFGRAELGWSAYEPLIANEIGVACPAGSPGFAAALAVWQKTHRLPATGVLNQPTFIEMKQVWQQRRPFVLASRIACPPAPDAAALSRAEPGESYGGKTILLRTAALAAYRRMVAAARKELPVLTADPHLLTIFSGYRSPDYDAARCFRDQNCQGVVRAACSAHRTGYAMDLYLGAAPGFGPDSSADANRLYLSRTAAYRWLVDNASRFGFVNYAFEPWHWEWTGEASR